MTGNIEFYISEPMPFFHAFLMSSCYNKILIQYEYVLSVEECDMLLSR